MFCVFSSRLLFFIVVCGSVENNALNSPGYPANYPHNLLCVYRVNIPQGKELNIHFNYFSLQRGDCK